ncbi:uncharacterized protein DEA37_0006743 [Paragonimus westermani]|uniref:Integrase catalytic domain-containing protein n=1 Tax=Paragonimus westermani TaxID=34504 RepID=A0A5J4N602_9TREM|nr:uncharacterized protein DEA37_0006743 [Paragonimus westermani]
MGPLPTSIRGNKYILVIVDYFTKYREAFPTPNQAAYTVTSLLVNEWVACFCPPIQLHPDHCAAFGSRLLKGVCRELRMNKTRTTLHHPHSNGLVKRTSRNPTIILRTFNEGYQSDR